MQEIRHTAATWSARGRLAVGEDVSRILALAESIHDATRSGVFTPLVHGDVSGRDREQELESQLARLAQRRLKRYVVRAETAAGPRILKITEPGSWLRQANVFDQRAYNEHHWHRRAEHLGLAATESRGYLQLRRGLLPIRGVQVQTVMDPELVCLEHHLASEVVRFGHLAIEVFAEHLAEVHQLGFFHADLKGFHAFVRDVKPMPSGPSRYRLLWFDFGRVSFRLSERRRLINLYQVFRFILPPDEQAKARFVARYCAASDWHADDWERVLARVHHLVRRKLKTHPVASSNPWPSHFVVDSTL